MKNKEKKFITIGYSVWEKPAFWYGDSLRLEHNPELLAKINACEKIIRLLLSNEEIKKLQEFEKYIEETALALKDLLNNLPEKYHLQQKKWHKDIFRKSLLPLLIQVVPDIKANMTSDS